MDSLFDRYPEVDVDDHAFAWLMHLTKRNTFASPLQNGALMLIDFSSKRVEDYAANFPTDQLSPAMNGTGVYMTDLFRRDSCLGSGWVFTRDTTRAAQSGRAGEGILSGGAMLEMRFMKFVRGSALHLISTVVASEDHLALIHQTEVDGRCIVVQNGTIHRRTLTVRLDAPTCNRRFCYPCLLRGDFCTCSDEDVRPMFESYRVARQEHIERRYAEGLFGNRYSKYKLQGSWSCQKGDRRPVQTDITCFDSGPIFDRAVNLVVQNEVTAALSPGTHKLFNHARKLESNQARKLESHRGAAVAMSSGSVSEEAPPRSFVCTHCQRSYRREYDLRRHVRSVHEGKRDFQCPHCAKSYSQSGHLNEHVRAVHTGGDVPACAQCGKTFGAWSKLNRHMRSVHLNLRTYTCPHCHKSYKERSTLKDHCRNAHGQMLPAIYSDDAGQKDPSYS